MPVDTSDQAAEQHPAEVPEEEDILQAAHDKMHKDLRSWGVALLVLGVIHLVASGFLSSPWGILLIVVGLMSFLFREAVMFVLYAVTLIWAGISNLASLEIYWGAFALLQFYWAFRVFQRFTRYRQVEADYAARFAATTPGATAPPSRAATIFPWASLALGGVALAGSFFLVCGVLSMLFVDFPGSSPSFAFVETLSLFLAILAIALGAGALLAHHPNRTPTIGGLVGGGVRLLIQLGFMLLVLLAGE